MTFSAQLPWILGGRHIEVGLPRSAEFSFPEILANPVIEQCVLRRVVPPAVRCGPEGGRVQKSMTVAC